MAHDAPWEHYHGPPQHIGGHDERIAWTTVGFDVGSSTSQLAFSRVTLVRHDAHYVVEERELLHESEVILTPYASAQLIDASALERFVAGEYARAGLSPSDVDTGAVILTGLALSRTNSRAIAQAIAHDSGKFIAISAGDVLEARLAANGAGAQALSARSDGVLAHIDVGGGTTKLSAWRAGQLLGVAAIDIGARLMTFDRHDRVTRIEEPLTHMLSELGLDIRCGQQLPDDQAERLAGALARNILRYAGVLAEPPPGRSLLRTPALFDGDPPAVSAVIFTGGVSEYVYGRETRSFGDLGLRLGLNLAAEAAACDARLLPLAGGIRATVTGVSQHSVQLSGVTVFVSDSHALPLRNLPIVAPALDLSPEGLDQHLIDAATRTALQLFDAEDRCPAISIQWRGSATYQRLGAAADGLAAALGPHLGEDEPCVVLVDGDVAGVLGARLSEAFAGLRPVICLDGVHVHEFDHIDIGEFAPRTRSLPVVVKSLLFSSAPSPASTHEHHAA